MRTLSILDTCTREALAIAVNTSLPDVRVGTAVIRLLDGIIQTRQGPQQITLGNGHDPQAGAPTSH